MIYNLAYIKTSTPACARDDVTRLNVKIFKCTEKHSPSSNPNPGTHPYTSITILYSTRLQNIRINYKLISY